MHIIGAGKRRLREAYLVTAIQLKEAVSWLRHVRTMNKQTHATAFDLYAVIIIYKNEWIWFLKHLLVNGLSLQSQYLSQWFGIYSNSWQLCPQDFL